MLAIDWFLLKFPKAREGPITALCGIPTWLAANRPFGGVAGHHLGRPRLTGRALRRTSLSLIFFRPSCLRLSRLDVARPAPAGGMRGVRLCEKLMFSVHQRLGAGFRRSSAGPPTRRNQFAPAEARIIACQGFKEIVAILLCAIAAGLAPAAGWIWGRPSEALAAALCTTAWAGSSQSIIG